MFGRDRGDRGALVALAIVVAGAVIVAWLGNPSDQIIESHANPNGSGQNGQRQLLEQAVYWGIFTARDTFAQWIAATAAILSFAASVWAIWLVRHTLKETKRTADAAVKSADFVEASFLRSQRPYIHVKVLESHRLLYPDEGEPHITYTFENFGTTPAIVIGFNVRLEKNPSLPLRLPFSRFEPWYEVIEPKMGLNNRNSVTVDGSIAGQALSNRQQVVFHGFVIYKDQMGANCFDSFCLRWSGAGFTLEGGDEYNNRKTIYPKDWAAN